MSWSTYVVGRYAMKSETPAEIYSEIKREISDVCEVSEKSIRYDEADKVFSVEDISYVSHVAGRNIVEVFRKYKKHIEYFAFSVYYLNEADDEIFYDEMLGEQIRLLEE